MIESSLDEAAEVAPAEQAPFVEIARPQLRLHHLFAITAVMAILLGINGPQSYDWNPQVPQSPFFRSVSFVLQVLHQICASVAVTAVAYGIAWRRRGLPFFDEPGHWLLVEIALTTILGIVPAIAVRWIGTDFQQLSPGDSSMIALMILGVYSLLFLVGGRMAINIYLGKTKCDQRQWKWVFYAKALAAIVAGLGEIVVIAITLNAVRRDRQQQLPRDAGHRCGVAVQLALSGLMIVGFAVGIVNLILSWPMR